jgi:hypothetical protein
MRRRSGRTKYRDHGGSLLNKGHAGVRASARGGRGVWDAGAHTVVTAVEVDVVDGPSETAGTLVYGSPMVLCAPTRRASSAVATGNEQQNRMLGGTRRRSGARSRDRGARFWRRSWPCERVAFHLALTIKHPTDSRSPCPASSPPSTH